MDYKKYLSIFFVGSCFLSNATQSTKTFKDIENYGPQLEIFKSLVSSAKTVNELNDDIAYYSRTYKGFLSFAQSDFGRKTICNKRLQLIQQELDVTVQGKQNKGVDLATNVDALYYQDL